MGASNDTEDVVAVVVDTAPQRMVLPGEPVVDLSGDELSQDMRRRTEPKAAGAVKTDADIEAEAAEHLAPKGDEDDDDEPESAKKSDDVPFDEYMDAADNMVGLFEGAMALGFPPAYMRAAFDKEERKIVRKCSNLFALCEKARPGAMILKKLEENNLEELFERWKEVRELVERIPIDDKVALRLQKVVAKILKKYAKKPGPESELAMLLLGILAPRCSPFMAGIV